MLNALADLKWEAMCFEAENVVCVHSLHKRGRCDYIQQKFGGYTPSPTQLSLEEIPMDSHLHEPQMQSLMQESTVTLGDGSGFELPLRSVRLGITNPAVRHGMKRVGEGTLACGTLHER